MNPTNIVFTSGSRRIVSTRERGMPTWTSRLYVNNGETATQVTAQHVTRRGVEKWAAIKLGDIETMVAA